MAHKPILFIAAIVTIGLYTCISYRNRPARLYQQVVDKGQTFDAGIVPGFLFYVINSEILLSLKSRVSKSWPALLEATSFFNIWVAPIYGNS